MVDLRPHRRLAVPFFPPFFSDLIALSDFISGMYEHFGVACFRTEDAFTGTPVLRRMCDSLGLKMLVECPDAPQALKAAVEGADFVVVPSDSIYSVVSGRPRKCAVLVAVKDDMDVEMFRVSAADGVFCAPSRVAHLRESLIPGTVLFATSGGVVDAVKGGADFALVDGSVLHAGRPDRAARDLAEQFRDFT